MERLACAEIPALPLQLLLREHPEWRRHPSAVVVEDLPQSPVLWVNAPARDGGVAPGLRYGSALAIVPELRAAPVADADIVRAVDAVTGALRRFSPNVEPAVEEPGVFWFDASGLEYLHASLAAWAEEIRRDLGRAGYEAAVAVGFTRFGTYAAARAGRGVLMFTDPDEEQTAVRRVRLRDLQLPPETLEALGRLGVRTVDDLLRLPAGGLLERFGPAAERLHRRASGDLWAPLVPRPAIDPVQRHLTFDAAETDAQRLVFIVKHALHPLLTQLASRGQALAALTVRLRLEREWAVHVFRPATPTLETVRLIDLVRLRLESVRLDAGVSELCLEAGGAPATPEQLALMTEQPPRDLEAGTRAIDRLRARYGDEAVVCAVPRDGHLPEARFGWIPMAQLSLPRPARIEGRSLIRRVFTKPVPLPAGGPAGARPDVNEPAPPVVAGPFIVSGGWWAAPPREDGVREAHRTYYFMEGPRGELWWVFYDRARRHWYMHGQVE
ncbi:MAG TPA: DNA polymerase Y family protein [bacterium]|nr:DNA polymerase Y family protein [bacterium]